MEIKTEENGGQDMSNGIGTDTAGVLALLADTNRAGRGGGYWGGEGGIGGGYGNVSNAVRLDRNAQQTENQADCTRDVLGLGLDRISDAFNSAEQARNFSSMCDRVSGLEIRQQDRLRDIEREMNANARVAADCCCDLKIQACNDKSEIMSAIAAQGAKTIERDLDRAERENVYLRTISTCGCGCGGGVKPCP